MVEVHFNEETFHLERVIAEIKNENKKSIVVFIGGIHGNEPTGVVALKKVFDKLTSMNLSWQGDVYAFAGNLQALAADSRFIDRDLNRSWTPSQITKIESRALEKTIAETKEQYALYDHIWPLTKENVPIYLIDLHTTSSFSAPFITINDVLVNRDYSLKFPVPIVLGIEEYISGPLLSYMNHLDTVSLAFEAGQHEDVASLENHISFIYLALVHAGVIDQSQLPDYNLHKKRLEDRGREARGVYEIRYKKHIESSDKFKMKPGYVNFGKVNKGEIVAMDKTGEIASPEKGRIFMPLYQNQGNDGFFLIKDVPRWALTASRLFRKWKLDNILTLLPGVKRDSNNPNSIIVDNKIALFLAKDLFHLLGYRRKKEINNVMYFSRREVD